MNDGGFVWISSLKVARTMMKNADLMISFANQFANQPLKIMRTIWGQNLPSLCLWVPYCSVSYCSGGVRFKRDPGIPKHQ